MFIQSHSPAVSSAATFLFQSGFICSPPPPNTISATQQAYPGALIGWSTWQNQCNSLKFPSYEFITIGHGKTDSCWVENWLEMHSSIGWPVAVAFNSFVASPFSKGAAAGGPSKDNHCKYLACCVFFTVLSFICLSLFTIVLRRINNNNCPVQFAHKSS